MKKIRTFLKHPVTKKILLTLIVIGVTAVLTHGTVGGEVFAQSNSEPTFSDSIESTTTMLDAILKILYIILWPLLWLAGISLDNTLVYGSFFHLDAPLWKFWNIIKNFANFTLGFLVLREIIKSIFTGFNQGDAIGKPFDVIKKTLIAGILIQASWFIFAALIDVSTIATYAIGGMPLSMIGETELGNKPIIGNASKLDLNNLNSETLKKEGFTNCGVYNQNGKKYFIPECARDDQFIVGQNKESCKDQGEKGETVLKNICTPGGGRLIGLSSCPDEYAALAAAEPGSIEYDDAQIYLDTCLEGDADMVESIGDYRLNTNDSEVMRTAQQEGIDNLANAVNTNIAGLKTLADLIEKSQGLVGPFITIYTSILDFTSIAHGSIQANGNISVAIEMITKLVFSLALIIPLLLMVITLLKRVLFLWLVIATSPFIILKEVFDKQIGEAANKMDFISKHLSLGNIIKVIFSPVFVVFSLSISIIFLQAISQSFNDTYNSGADKAAFEKGMGIETIESTNSSIKKIGGNAGVEIEVTGDSGVEYGSARDIVSWSIINLFTIAIVWSLLFATLQFNSLGGALPGKVKKRTENKLGQIPIIPYGGGVGVGTAAKIIGKESIKELNTRADETSAAQIASIEDKLGWNKDTSGSQQLDADQIAKHLTKGNLRESGYTEDQLISIKEDHSLLQSIADEIQGLREGSRDRTSAQENMKASLGIDLNNAQSFDRGIGSGAITATNAGSQGGFQDWAKLKGAGVHEIKEGEKIKVTYSGGAYKASAVTGETSTPETPIPETTTPTT